MPKDIRPTDFVTLFEQYAYQVTFFSLPGWYVLGCRCGECERETWLDREELARRFGEMHKINQLAPGLRCRKCGNKAGNRFTVGKARQGEKSPVENF